MGLSLFHLEEGMAVTSFLLMIVTIFQANVWFEGEINKNGRTNQVRPFLYKNNLFYFRREPAAHILSAQEEEKRHQRSADHINIDGV